MRLPIVTILIIFLAFEVSSQDKVVTTDSSVIKFNYSAHGHSENEQFKDRNRNTYKWINKNNIIETLGFFDSSGSMIGVWKEFDEQGRLIRTEDYDNRIWTVYNSAPYPYKKLFDLIKRKADSLVIETYGKTFFAKYAKWDFSQSGYNFKDGSGGNWTDPVDRKPATFMLRYDIQFDKDHQYDDLIEFELDNKGNFIGNEYEEVYGFERLPSKTNGFRLTYQKAMQLAKQRGLVETDSAKAEGILWWECAKTSKYYNGKYRFYITIETNAIKSLVPMGRSSITKKYDVYVFNPWTGDFIEKRKMKSNYSWEEGHGSSTGLMPDK